MNNVLLDTSILIDYSRRPDKYDTALVKLQQSGAILFVSIITHTEIYSGKSIWEKKEIAEEAENLFSGLQVLPLDVKLSKMAGEIKAHYNGTIADSIIAATAIRNKLMLVTFNIKDFKKIKGLKILKYPLEN